LKHLRSLLLLALVGCSPSVETPARPQHGRQPINSTYQLDTINAFMVDSQAATAEWITQHPNAEIVSICSPNANGYLLVVYKAR
jgi:hypothetical protein